MRGETQGVGYGKVGTDASGHGGSASGSLSGTTLRIIFPRAAAG